MRLFSAIVITWSIHFVFVAPYPHDQARNGNGLATRLEPRSPWDPYNEEEDGEHAPEVVETEPEAQGVYEEPKEMTEEEVQAAKAALVKEQAEERAKADTFWLKIVSKDLPPAVSCLVVPPEEGKPVRFRVGYQDMSMAWKSGRRGIGDALTEEYTYAVSDAERNQMRQEAVENPRDGAAAAGPDGQPVERIAPLWDSTVSTISDDKPLEMLRHAYTLARGIRLAEERGVPLVIVLPGKPKGLVQTTFSRFIRLLARAKPSNAKPYVQPTYVDKQSRISIRPRPQRKVTTVGSYFQDRKTLIDPPEAALPVTSPRGLGKRESSVLSQLGPASGSTSNGKSTSNPVAQSEVYWEAFQVIQNNISDTIFPFLKDMVNGSNSSVVYNAAWSIWADLTMANEYVDGPFHYGLHQFDTLEDQYAKANKLSTTDPAYLNVLAVNAVLIDLYQTAWNQSMAALNATDLLDLRDGFAAILIQSNSTSTQLAPSDYDDEFFVTYNS